MKVTYGMQTFEKVTASMFFFDIILVVYDLQGMTSNSVIGDNY